MKLITFQTSDQKLKLGALRADDETLIIDLAAGGAGLGHPGTGSLSSMMALIEAGDEGMAAAQDVVAAARNAPAEWAAVPAGSIRWKSPLPVPPQFRDCLMFEDHLINSFAMLRKTLASQSADPEAALAEYEAKGLYRIPPVWYQIPVYYKANRFSFIGHEEDIVWPSYTEKLDFELEFACVLNRRVKDASVDEAAQCIFGYTIFNDVSARDVQSVEMQASLGPSKGKDFDTGNVLGPCIVTADSVDPRDMTMIARVNGEEWCRGNSGTSHWTFPQIIAHASKSETLMPGECIGSGTIGGGCGLEHGRFLNPGDVVELEVSGIGTLRNRVVRAAS